MPPAMRGVDYFICSEYPHRPRAIRGERAMPYWRRDSRAGGQVKKIDADEKVDFTRPGVERFMTLPLDPTEGTCHDVAT